MVQARITGVTWYGVLHLGTMSLLRAVQLAYFVGIPLCLAVGACAALKSRAPDPATAAREARKASVLACNAYDAAVRAGAAKANDRADFACAATRGICADDVELERDADGGLEP